MKQIVEYWGYELLLDCAECDREKISSSENIDEYVKVLISRIDMKAYGEPQIVYFGKHNENVSGYTLTQLIETSSITGHFVDKSGAAYINVHSCKQFDKKVVIETTQEFFNPKRIKDMMVYRLA